MGRLQVEEAGVEILQHLLAIHHAALARCLRYGDHQRRGDEQVVGHNALGLVVHCAWIGVDYGAAHQDVVQGGLAIAPPERVGHALLKRHHHHRDLRAVQPALHRRRSHVEVPHENDGDVARGQQLAQLLCELVLDVLVLGVVVVGDVHAAHP